MSWNQAYQKKWIKASSTKDMQVEKAFTNKCMLVAKSDKGSIEGFTVFEPRDLNEDFFARLTLRAQSDEMKDLELTIYTPAFLEHRLNELVLAFNAKSLRCETTGFLALKVTRGIVTLRTKMRVVNIDDSAVLLKLLAQMFTSSGWIDVIDQVSDPLKAVDTILRLSPDLVTLDIQMPNKTGVEVVKELFLRKQFPVLMVSSLSMEEGSLVFEALNAGAFDYIQKPTLEERESFRKNLLHKALLAVGSQASEPVFSKLQIFRPKPTTTSLRIEYDNDTIWCLGASTGGTQALTRVFTSLPADIPPTLVVQHIPPIFSNAFAKSLDALCPFTVKEAENGDVVKPNHVYIARGGMQMSLERSGGRYLIVLNDDDPVNRFKPSVDYLFHSVAAIKGLKIKAGVLTGMGRDGAEGLLALKKTGAETFAQDEASSAVYGMPRAAAQLGAADIICHIDDVANVLVKKTALANAG